MASTPKTTTAPVSSSIETGKIEMKATNIPHIFMVDIDDSGMYRECAIVKLFDDGSIAYVQVDTLHPIDKARLKKVVTSIHADKYPLYELLSQAKFSNGLNALDYVHTNFVKIKRPKGTSMTSNSILSTSIFKDADHMIGSDFVNPAEALLDQTTKTFM